GWRVSRSPWWCSSLERSARSASALWPFAELRLVGRSNEALLFQPGAHMPARLGLSIGRVLGDRPAVMIAVHAMPRFVACPDRREDRVGILRENAVVAGVLDHQRRLRDRRGAALHAGIG